MGLVVRLVSIWDVRAEYCEGEMSTGGTRAIWGVAVLKKKKGAHIQNLHNSAPLANETTQKGRCLRLLQISLEMTVRKVYVRPLKGDVNK